MVLSASRFYPGISYVKRGLRAGQTLLLCPAVVASQRNVSVVKDAVVVAMVTVLECCEGQHTFGGRISFFLRLAGTRKSKLRPKKKKHLFTRKQTDLKEYSTGFVSVNVFVLHLCDFFASACAEFSSGKQTTE